MSTEKTVTGVAAIELEAEKVLEEAREKANKIIADANVQVNAITSQELNLDDVNAECEKIVAQAKEEAAQKIATAKEQATAIKEGTEQKVNNIVSRMIMQIMGMES